MNGEDNTKRIQLPLKAFVSEGGLQSPAHPSLPWIPPLLVDRSRVFLYPRLLPNVLLPKKKVWKLMKRISTGGLGDKLHLSNYSEESLSYASSSALPSPF